MPIAPLQIEHLRWRAEVSAEDSASAQARRSFPLGQGRAEDAIAFALPLRRHGYHMYVSGPSGTGRTTYCLGRLHEAAESLPSAEDWIFLPNFELPGQPQAVPVPTGAALRFESLLGQLRREIAERLPRAFASEEFAEARNSLAQQVNAAGDAAFHEFQKAAEVLGFRVEAGPTGLRMTPLQGGRPLSDEEVATLPEGERAALERNSAEVASLGQKFVHAVHERQNAGREAELKMQRELAVFTCRPLFQRAREAAGAEALEAHLDRLLDRIGDWLSLFVEPEGDAPRPADTGWFRINAFVAREEGAPAPVVYEPNPTYYNLLGRIDYTGGEQGLTTDFTHIRAGAIHRANGGFLILPARALLSEHGSYEGLKRALSRRASLVENIGQHERPVPVEDLTPGPIPLDIQVVLIGPEGAYHELREMDEDFRKLFKVRADFAPDMPNSEEHRAEFLAFLKDLCRAKGILPFAPDGLGRMLEEAARMAGGKLRLSTRMAQLADLAVEAESAARSQGQAEIRAEDVRAALRGRHSLFGQHQERWLEMITGGMIRIETRGASVGQINGLTVLTTGEVSFGLPARITARTYAGGQGVIDIEREIALSGPIHSKGVYTLSGYLGWRFGRSRPLALSASLTIEQNYGGIEGDSASSTELYAILSDLANLPVRQEIAVTGSVDQKGRIQPIGGVNEKIEGFFAVCRAQGLTGQQGCMIPRPNVPDLMLSDEVLEACQAGEFHVWAIDTIEQGISLLTGVPSGVEDDSDAYQPGSVFARAAGTLMDYADAVDHSGTKERGERPA